MGFLRHGRKAKFEYLLELGIAARKPLPSGAHYSMLPAFGYPSAGCSQAELDSVLPDIVF